MEFFVYDSSKGRGHFRIAWRLPGLQPDGTNLQFLGSIKKSTSPPLQALRSRLIPYSSRTLLRSLAGWIDQRPTRLFEPREEVLQEDERINKPVSGVLEVR